MVERERKVEKQAAVMRAEVCKIDKDRRLVFGFAIVCKDEDRGGKAGYTDLQKQHIPEDVMLDGALDFFSGARLSDVMHDESEDGVCVFGFPLTTEIAKALDISTKRTGLLIGMRPSKKTFAKFESGKLTSFSIGGTGYVVEEEVDAEEEDAS